MGRYCRESQLGVGSTFTVQSKGKVILAENMYKKEDNHLLTALTDGEDMIEQFVDLPITNYQLPLSFELRHRLHFTPCLEHKLEIFPSL